MATGTGWVRDASKPGHHDAWSRIQLGWVDPIVITKNGYYAIQASEISGHIYKISKNFPSGEYLLIENRQPIKWDSDLPKNQSAGIVIWHIDENADGQRTRGYPGHPNWPLEHYMVSMVQADGKYDIERAVNLGDTGDFWQNGQSLGPGGSDPNTDSYRFGERRSTGLKITITSDPGFIMTFQVEGINGTIRSADRTSRGGNTSDPQSTMSTVRWILSMLLGAAALIGVLAIILV
jgi:hypothetical protein